MQLMPQVREDPALYGKNYSNFEHSFFLPRHRWYEFKEGFSPLIVQEAICNSDLCKKDLVFDPFVGSGTVPIVAAQSGFRCIGFEVNPFISFMASTKLLSPSQKNFLRHSGTILKACRRGHKSSLEGFSTFTKHNGNAKWLFNKGVLRAFEGGWIKSDILPKNIRSLYRLALLNSALTNANAQRDGKCLRYKSNWTELDLGTESFVTSLESNLNSVAEDLERDILPDITSVIPKDVRNYNFANFNENFKLCITSPPYLNSFDYTDIYRPELFLGKFVKSQFDLRQLRLRTIRSHVQAKWNIPKLNNFGQIYEHAINEIIANIDSLWNKRIPLMIQAYFEDMENVLRKLLLVSNKTSSLWIIVSTSAYAGIEIPVDLILADIGSKLGWKLEEVKVIRHLRHSAQNAVRWLSGDLYTKRLRESIIVFKGRY